MKKAYRIFAPLSSVVMFVTALTLVSTVAAEKMAEPRGE
jgi:hypothetical protein